jgi:hypothetical protein
VCVAASAADQNKLMKTEAKSRVAAVKLHREITASSLGIVGMKITIRQG